MLGNTFKYVHFNYIDGFGLLCLPPRMAPKNVSERNLGICWHEVAGHAIATARRRHREKLVKWTTTLQERLQTAGYWGHYSELYQQSILDNLCGRAKYEKAGILPKIDKIIREDIFEKNPITVDGDGDWQITWLLELLEDWFWILVGKEGNMPGELADGVTTVLADALAKTYENLRVGDPNHPPPHLRILVGINYLCNGDQECIDQRIDRFVGGGEDIFGFTQAGPDRELSAVIASVCQEILDEQGDNPWLYQTEVTDQERNIAAKILNGQPLSLNELLDPDQEGILAADPDIIDQINTAEDLESLLAIDFTTDDFFPLGGATPWPPQRFGFR